MIYDDVNVSPRIGQTKQNPNHSQMYINEAEVIS